MIGLFKNNDSELKLENELLKFKVEEQDKMIFDLTQKNSLMDNHIKELEDDLQDYYKIQDREQEKLEEYLLRGNTDYYKTEELDRKQIFDSLDKLTEERNIYKEVINIMCDKFNIEHDTVFNIIDDISQNKSVGIERV